MLDAMARHKSVEIPPDLRTRLENARLDLLALFRALDQMSLTPDLIPQRLIRQLFELDADYVEALWGLDQPPGKLNLQAMVRDTLAALQQLPAARTRFRDHLPLSARSTLANLRIKHPCQPEPGRGLQHGSGPEPPNRLSTPLMPPN